MSISNFTEELLNLQGVKITKIEQFETATKIFIEHEYVGGVCPHCGEVSRKVHDYRTQTIKDATAFGKHVYLVLRKRRLHCEHCGHHFYQHLTFLPRYYRMTKRLIETVILALTDVRSFTSVAKEFNLSLPTVIRIFDLVQYPRPNALPRTLAMDEFKGNTGGQKFNCIITDPENHQVLDIIEKRYGYYVDDYFRRNYSREERNKVELFVSDMWKPYQDCAKYYFPKATRVIDKYHWARQMTWAFENVRKSEQKKFNKQYRIYFKRSRQLLLQPFDFLPQDNQRQVLIMLDISVNLSRSHFYKEWLQTISRIPDPLEKQAMFKQWLASTSEAKIPQFRRCTETYYRWLPEILNSMETPITNGFTEGCNNKIKVLKRNAYGYRNFRRFRNRILHIFSHQRAA